MWKTATLICVGLCLAAPQALAETNTRPEGTVTLASASGLYVRVAVNASHAAIGGRNVCGAAVNTGGIARATTAVKTGGRVFLTSGRSTAVVRTELAAVTSHKLPEPPVTARKHPEGLGVVLARILGLG